MVTLFKPMRAENKEKEFTELLLSGKGIKKNFGSHDCLNLFYKESNILLKHIVKHHKVTCYYKEPSKK